MVAAHSSDRSILAKGTGPVDAIVGKMMDVIRRRLPPSRTRKNCVNLCYRAADVADLAVLADLRIYNLQILKNR